jgi:hypothetical protein
MSRSTRPRSHVSLVARQGTSPITSRCSNAVALSGGLASGCTSSTPEHRSAKRCCVRMLRYLPPPETSSSHDALVGCDRRRAWDRASDRGDPGEEAVTVRAADMAEAAAPLTGWVNNAAVFRDAWLHEVGGDSQPTAGKSGSCGYTVSRTDPSAATVGGCDCKRWTSRAAGSRPFQAPDRLPEPPLPANGA